MKRVIAFYRSTIGKKVLLAVTGVVLLGFLVSHVAGNLKVFLPEAAPGVPDIDAYAEALRTIGVPLLPHSAVLWSTRIVLLISLILHLTCAIQLSMRNRAARPVRYEKQRLVRATAPARWMLFTGSLLLLFIVFHILHFTTGSVDPNRFVEGAVYFNLSGAFAQWGLVALYGIGLAVLGLHVYHGAWSLFQTLGADHPDRNRSLRGFAVALAMLLFLGFVAVPASFFLGVLEPSPTHPRTASAKGAH